MKHFDQPEFNAFRKKRYHELVALKSAGKLSSTEEKNLKDLERIRRDQSPTYEEAEADTKRLEARLVQLDKEIEAETKKLKQCEITQ